MNSDILSQEEIEALLRGEIPSQDEQAENESQLEDSPLEKPTENISENQEIHSNDSINSDNTLTELEIDALGEIGNISMGTSATTLSTLLNRKVNITIPTVSLTSAQSMVNRHETQFVAVDVSWQIGLEGSNVMILNSDDVKIIADLMMGKQEDFDTSREVNEIDLSAVSEAMNQMMGSTATSLSEMFNKKVDISPPKAVEIKTQDIDNLLDVLKDPEPIIAISFRMVVEDLIDTSFVQLIPIRFGKEMVAYLFDGTSANDENIVKENVTENKQEKLQNEVQNQSKNSNLKPQPHPQQNKQEVQPPQQHQQYQQQYYQPPQKDSYVVSQPNFESFDTGTYVPRMETIDLVGDIPVELTVELGRANKNISEILEFSQGTVIELNKLVGESLDIYANGKFIAKGEVVVIDDNFGVRVTEIESINKNII